MGTEGFTLKARGLGHASCHEGSGGAGSFPGCAGTPTTSRPVQPTSSHFRVRALEVPAARPAEMWELPQLCLPLAPSGAKCRWSLTPKVRPQLECVGSSCRQGLIRKKLGCTKHLEGQIERERERADLEKRPLSLLSIPLSSPHLSPPPPITPSSCCCHWWPWQQ